LHAPFSGIFEDCVIPIKWIVRQIEDFAKNRHLYIKNNIKKLSSPREHYNKLALYIGCFFVQQEYVIMPT